MTLLPLGLPLGPLMRVASAVLMSAGLGERSVATVGGPDPELQRDMEQVLQRTGWSRAHWGVLAVSLDRGDTLVSLNPDQVLIPASNMKLVTSAAALHFLGPDFRFRTFVMATGPIVDGTLEGDLVLYGTGDPSISWRFHETRTEPLERLARAVRAAGIERIAGAVVGDGSYFAEEGRHASWDPRDFDDWFAAPATALSYNENVVTLRVVPAARAGLPPLVHMIPEGARVPLNLDAMTVSGRPRSRFHMARPSPGEPIRIAGDLALRSRDSWRQFAVNDGVDFATGMFEETLREGGIWIRDPYRTLVDPSQSLFGGAPEWRGGEAANMPQVVAIHESPPLSELLKVTNKMSHNLFAELIYRALGRIVVGDGSYAGGGRAVTRYLVEEVGVPPEGLMVSDGSGLSRENRISAGSFIQVLKHAAADSVEWDALWSSLPEAGNRELRRMGRSAAEQNLRAKTGTLTGVSALSGQVTTVEGERILFSILSNDVPSRGQAKRVEDLLSIRLASLRRSSRDGGVALGLPSGP